LKFDNSGRRTCAGAAGLLSLAGGASAATGPMAHLPTEKTEHSVLAFLTIPAAKSWMEETVVRKRPVSAAYAVAVSRTLYSAIRVLFGFRAPRLFARVASEERG
jgi:hypothetical protein